MEYFKILNIEKFTESSERWISVKIKDNRKNFIFWIDCSLMDGFGNRENFKTEDLYIDWDFNQYIFNLENEKDLYAKQYQEDPENIDYLTDFIDENNNYLVNILKNMEVK